MKKNKLVALLTRWEVFLIVLLALIPTIIIQITKEILYLRKPADQR